MDDETYVEDDLRRIDVADILGESERLLELRTPTPGCIRSS
jgi:hypothetical protein